MCFRQLIKHQNQKAGKLEYYTPNDIQVDIDDWVVVESKRGIEIGIVKNPVLMHFQHLVHYN
jgi:cell fate regulator YaaT (PSP1 superfamily)